MRQSIRCLLLSVLLAGCVNADDAGVEDDAAPVLAIESGVEVKGAGPRQQWEGIVMTRSRIDDATDGLCTATFITGQHLLTAAHCYEASGRQRVSVRAPTWNDNAWQTFDALVLRASDADLVDDIAVVDLRTQPAWATPARRFKLNAAPVTLMDLHLYGYGSRSNAEPELDGALRAAPGRATVRVRNAGGGYLTAIADVARGCTGDSGGPALREGTEAVVWGIASSFGLTPKSPDGAVCASRGASLTFVNVAEYLTLIEQILGRPCTRVVANSQPAAQCW